MPAFLYRIPTRIYAIVALALVFSALLTVVLLSRAVDNAYRMRETELRGVTDLAISLLADLEAQVEAGEIDRATAQEMGRAHLHTLRYGGSGYVFAFDHDLVVTAHPTQPQWIGTNKSSYEDVKGLRLFAEMRRVVRADGAGRVDYFFQKPGESTPERKVSFVQEFEPWGWMIGTGAYVSDIRADLAELRNAAIISLALGIVLLAVISTLLVRSVTGPIGAIVAAMNDVAHKRYGTKIEVAERRDEIGALGRNLADFRDKLAESDKLAEAREADRAEQERVVKELGVALQNLSQGDLTRAIDAPFTAEYEGLRHDFNSTIDTLNSLMADVVENATEIRGRAEEIAGASDDLSHRTETQAATLEETAAALDELTGSVRSAAEGAAEVEGVVRSARGDAEASGRVVSDAVDAMGEIKRSSDEISQIIGVIDDIAFQTNLLALNAGVEAARAGEAGRGFAVVASEVRALAQRSSEAAREIKELISASSGQVESGVALVNRAGEALSDIVGRVGNIADLVSEIATGAQEQSVGLGEINVGVTQLDQVTQQNAAMVEEATAASATLRHEAETLQGLVARFRLKDGGTTQLTATPLQAVPQMASAAARPAESRPRAVNDAGWQDF